MCSFEESPKWHEGAAWDRFFKIYDTIAQEQFAEGESKLVPTSFGDTQVHIRGNPKNPPLVFFHGISSCSLMFGNWLIPKLSRDYYCVAIDTIGDMGRSCPKDKEPKNGTKTQQDVADWALQVFNALNLLKDSNTQDGHSVVNIVGYSMGAFLACCVAQTYPEKVGKVLLLCPAGVVAPVRKAWLAQAISFGILSKIVPADGYFAERLQNWFFGSMMADPTSIKTLEYPELRKATDEVGMAQVQIQPVVYDVETLKKMTDNNTTMLVIGRQESVINATQAIDTATKSNMKLVVYDNAGHMLFCEHPREAVIDEMIMFLSDSPRGD